MKVQAVSEAAVAQRSELRLIRNQARQDSAALRADLADMSDLIRDVEALLDRQAERIYRLEKDLQTLVEENLDD